jgi:RNA polymerase sigma factor (sigma-70 family)
MWSLSDDALVTGFATGDPGTAAAFVRRFQARVFGLALNMVGDAAVAEEIAQEAFVRAWRHSGGYDARKGRVITWLLAITRNLAIDHLRSRRPEPIDPTIAGSAEALWARAAPDAGTSPGDGTAELRDALGELPADQRRALLLAALFGYTAREVGTIEDIPLGTAKTRIRTAMRKLAAADEQADRIDEADGERGEL